MNIGCSTNPHSRTKIDQHFVMCTLFCNSQICPENGTFSAKESWSASRVRGSDTLVLTRRHPVLFNTGTSSSRPDITVRTCEHGENSCRESHGGESRHEDHQPTLEHPFVHPGSRGWFRVGVPLGSGAARVWRQRPCQRAWPGLAEDLFLSKNGGKLWEIVKYSGRKYSTCAGECKSRGSV